MSRVALVSPYALSVPGGVQEQVLAMSRELARRDHDVLVVAPDGRDRATYDTPARVARFGTRLSLPANGSQAPLTVSPAAALAARREIEGFRPDVVHYHEPFAPLIGWSSLWRHRAPAVATFHRSGSGPALRLTGALLRVLAARLDVAVAVSPAAAATWSAATPLSPEVLFNGFEAERYRAFAREVPDEVQVIFVGRLEARKGAGDVIRAIQIHNATHPATPWRLRIVGDGPQRAGLEELASGDEHVSFLGAISDDKKRALLRRSSVAVAASTHGESFGLVVLEPMASEVPVVASDIEGYREAARGHATLYRAGDPASLAEAIETALATSTPESIAAAAAHAAHWSMAHLVDLYEGLYERARGEFSRVR
ncbi:MAG: glycosyltransferase family 4 protein [Acidobacteriota bacterium]|nr:glycosyltransferase family 4 protein [Acidobacteriota bacterium]